MNLIMAFEIFDYAIGTKKIDINKSIGNNVTGFRLARFKNNSNIINFLLELPDIQIGDDCFHKCKKIENIKCRQ